MTWRIKYQEPIGEEDQDAIVCGSMGCQHRRMMMPEYPESPQGKALRELRKARGFTLREAAHVLGMSSVELSKIEHGSMTFTTADGWGRAMKILEDSDGKNSQGRDTPVHGR